MGFLLRARSRNPMNIRVRRIVLQRRVESPLAGAHPANIRKGKCTRNGAQVESMIDGKKIIVVMPAYNADQTLERTYGEIPFDIVDDVILVDDYSKDYTINTAKKLGIENVIKHDRNKGYGGNQKTCYDKALEMNADIVIMLHPDYQYTPKLIYSMAYLIASGLYPVVFGCRILGRGAIKGGMPLYKYVSNRFLTAFENILIGQKLGEYHTGYRAYSAGVLKAVNYDKCSNGFIFDNEITVQIFNKGFEIAEITCPTRYFKEGSSINFTDSIIYGLGVLNVSVRYFLHKANILKYNLLED